MEQDQGTSTVAPEDDDDRPMTPEEEAAAEAVARAQQPPATATMSDEDRAAARRVAQSVPTAAERTDVMVVEDDYDEAMDKARDGQPMDEEELAAATEWLLSDEQEVNTRKLRIRIGGSDDAPEYGAWIIRAVGVDVIRSAEREASGNRAQRRQGGGYDELKANLRIVATGTVAPDLVALAKQRGLRDPVTLLERRFKFKSGIVAQLAGEVMSLSGFDAEDVKAAGN